MRRQKGRRRRWRKREAAEMASRATPEPGTTPTGTAGPRKPKSLPFEMSEDAPADAEQILLGEPVVSANRAAVPEDRSDADSEIADFDDLASSLAEQLVEQPQDHAQKEPATEDLLTRAAREAAERGDMDRALGIYRELLSLNPHNVRVRNNLALLLDRLGKHEDALEQLDLCLKHEASNAQVLINRGAVYGTIGRYREAERDLRRALQIDTTNPEAHYNLGLVVIRKGLWSEAIPSLRRAIELDASRAPAYYYLGEALNHVDDLQGALQAYQRAAELQPKNAKAFYGLGIMLDRLNRPDEAAQMYRRSREIAAR